MSRVLSIAYPERAQKLTSPVPTRSAAGPDREDVLAPYRRHPDDRYPREQRLTPEEVPLLSAVKLSWGLEVSLLNISSTGMLVETTSKFAPGSLTEFQLSGPTTSLLVPARFVRSEVAGVDTRAVRYHAAAVFERGLHLPTFLRADPSSTPRVLADLLTDVLKDLERGATPYSLRTKFEQGLRRLVPGCDIHIGDVVMIPRHGGESIYFTVPASVGSRAVLQATFKPGHEIAKAEFTLLKSAATLAAAVLEIENMPSAGT